MNDLLNSRFAPEIPRVLFTGSFFVLGMVVGWLLGFWRRFRQRRMAERGEAREVLTLEKILLEPRPDGALIMRIRSCGRDPIEEIFPNPAARAAFLGRVGDTKARNPLVSMEDKLGSYLLQELAIWVCGQVGERDFPHDLWVMAPVYESGTLYLGGHLSSTVLLVRQDDLARFRDWETCQAIQVEHRSHGERILTLMRMAAEFDRQHALVQQRRASGKRSTYEETMYILDLALDTRAFDLPTVPVPWERFEAILPPEAKR
ncbi:MAG: LapA family protein [Isosphaeraceae bacterium]